MDRYYEEDLDQLLENNTEIEEELNTTNWTPQQNAEWGYNEYERYQQTEYRGINTIINTYRSNHIPDSKTYKYDFEFTANVESFRTNSSGRQFIFQDECGDKYVCNLPNSKERCYQYDFCLSYNSEKPNLSLIEIK